jgi:hypothetical protein
MGDAKRHRSRTKQLKTINYNSCALQTGTDCSNQHPADKNRPPAKSHHQQRCWQGCQHHRHELQRQPNVANQATGASTMLTRTVLMILTLIVIIDSACAMANRATLPVFELCCIYLSRITRRNALHIHPRPLLAMLLRADHPC